MAGCERFGGCRRRRARACRSLPALTTSASCTRFFYRAQEASRCHSSPGRFCFLAGAASRPASDSSLLADDDESEGTGLHLSAAFAGSRRIEVGGGKEDVVGLEVESHGAG